MRRLLPLALASCIPLQFSGSNVPTDHTFKLTPGDIRTAESDACAVEWITDDAARNRDEALQQLDELGVRVVERDIAKFTTATPRRLFVGKGFADKPAAAQATTLTHELVHYCQMSEMGVEFFTLYAHSAGRWSIEVPASAQAIRTAKAQGASAGDVEDFINAKIDQMRDFYWLWDIDPAQYQSVTRRIWEAEL